MSEVVENLRHVLPPAFSTTLEVVVFFAGGQRCALEARQVRSLRPLILENNENYQAIDSLLGLSEQNKACSCRQIMTIRLPESDLELSVPAPVELQELAVDLIHPLPDMVAARTQLRGLCALVMETDGVTLMFDLRNLLSEVVTS